MASLQDPALLSHLVGRAMLDEAAKLFLAAGIPVMPLKGMWLQQVVYTSAYERRMSDLDLLVPEDRYEEAGDILRAAGWRCSCWNTWEATFRSPRYALPIDLHCELFPASSFKMPTADLFRRGRRDRETFGVELVLPDPLDVFAHLVGHFAKCQIASVLEPKLGPELAKLASTFHLKPDRVARHLEMCGMARAARYALTLSARTDSSQFCQRVADALVVDRASGLTVNLLLRGRSVLTRYWLLDTLRGFALESSWFQSARTFAYTIRDGHVRRSTAARHEQ
jgi:hypothetical protein